MVQMESRLSTTLVGRGAWPRRGRLSLSCVYTRHSQLASRPPIGAKAVVHQPKFMTGVVPTCVETASITRASSRPRGS